MFDKPTEFLFEKGFFYCIFTHFILYYIYTFVGRRIPMSRIHFDGQTGDELRERIRESGMTPKQKSLFFHWLDEYLEYLQKTDSPLTFEEWLKMTQC